MSVHKCTNGRKFIMYVSGITKAPRISELYLCCILFVFFDFNALWLMSIKANSFALGEPT